MSNTNFDSLAARRTNARRRCRQERVSFVAAFADEDISLVLAGRTLRGVR